MRPSRILRRRMDSAGSQLVLKIVSRSLTQPRTGGWTPWTRHGVEVGVMVYATHHGSGTLRGDGYTCELCEHLPLSVRRALGLGSRCMCRVPGSSGICWTGLCHCVFGFHLDSGMARWHRPYADWAPPRGGVRAPPKQCSSRPTQRRSSFASQKHNAYTPGLTHSAAGALRAACSRCRSAACASCDWRTVRRRGRRRYAPPARRCSLKRCGALCVNPAAIAPLALPARSATVARRACLSCSPAHTSRARLACSTPQAAA